jgi:hypothetical protein
MAKDKKQLKPKVKAIPPDAIAKGPNKKVPVGKFLDDCAS